jgi:hypothetical protein
LDRNHKSPIIIRDYYQYLWGDVNENYPAANALSAILQRRVVPEESLKDQFDRGEYAFSAENRQPVWLVNDSGSDNRPRPDTLEEKVGQ